MGFLSKNKGVPDVGKEEEYDNKNKKSPDKSVKKKETDDIQKIKAESKINKLGQDKLVNSEVDNIKFEKINARIETIDALVKGYSGRLTQLSEQIGEIRNMTLNNEKSISKSIAESGRAVDIVKNVKPEKLHEDFQKANLRIDALSERLVSNKQFLDTIMKEIKDLRRKAGIFIGTDALLKLNEEVKKDLIEIQKMALRVKVNSDKSEQLFIGLRKEYAEVQKMNSFFKTLEDSNSDLQKELLKIKVDYSNILLLKDFSPFKKHILARIMELENVYSKISEVKEENNQLSKLIETTLAVAKSNEEDIANLAISVGNKDVKRIVDYENQLESMLKIIDTIAGQIAQIKKKVGIKSEKIFIDDNKNVSVGKSKLKLKNIEVHPEISKHLVKKIKPFKKAVEKKNVETKLNNKNISVGKNKLKPETEYDDKNKLKPENIEYDNKNVLVEKNKLKSENTKTFKKIFKPLLKKFIKPKKTREIKKKILKQNKTLSKKRKLRKKLNKKQGRR